MAEKRPCEMTHWDGTTTTMPKPFCVDGDPEGALINSATNNRNQIAVVYNKGETPPEITISQQSRQVRTIMANGVAVAVVACALGPDLTAADVLLVERYP